VDCEPPTRLCALDVVAKLARLLLAPLAAVLVLPRPASPSKPDPLPPDEHATPRAAPHATPATTPATHTRAFTFASDPPALCTGAGEMSRKNTFDHDNDQAALQRRRTFPGRVGRAATARLQRRRRRRRYGAIV
jgi:hypothetical protein